MPLTGENGETRWFSGFPLFAEGKFAPQVGEVCERARRLCPVVLCLETKSAQALQIFRALKQALN